MAPDHAAAARLVRGVAEPLLPAVADDDAWVRLTRGQRAVTLAWLFVETLRTQGLRAWAGSSEHRPRETVFALRLIGATDHAGVVERVVQLYVAGDPSLAEIDRLHRQLLTLESADEVVADHAAPFVRANPHSFPGVAAG